MENSMEISSQENIDSTQNKTDNQLPYIECERLWYHLKDVQAEVQNLPPIASPAPAPVSTIPLETSGTGTQHPQNQAYEVLKQYEKRLRAELHCLKEMDLEELLSQTKEVQYVIVQQNLDMRREHLKHVVSYLKAKYSSLVDSNEEEKKLNTTLKQVQDSLKAKCAAINRAESGDDEDESVSDVFIADFKVKIGKLKDVNKHFQNELKELLCAFPSPKENESSRKSSKNSLDNSKEYNQKYFTSLSSIIGQLMEQTLNYPSQPYIDISERMWPQHIEFLLRSQIIVKHPDSSSRIKLIPFHL